MENISIETVKESNRIKREGVENCKKQLKDILSDEQLEMFEDFDTLWCIICKGNGNQNTMLTRNIKFYLVIFDIELCDGEEYRHNSRNGDNHQFRLSSSG